MYRLPRSVVSALVIAALIAGTLSGGREAPAAIAGAIAAVGLAFGVARPIVGLAIACIVALIAPFLIVPQRLGIQPPILDVIVVSVLLGVLVERVRRPGNMAPVWLQILVVVGVALPLAAGAAALVDVNQIEAFQIAIKMALYGATPLVVFYAVRMRSVLRSSVSLITGALTIQALLTLVIYVSGSAGLAALEGLAVAGYPSSGVARFLPDEITPRATGLLVDPNVLGVTLAAGLPFVVTWMVGRPRHTLPGIVALVLVCFALALTLSRASWIAAVVGLLVWMAVRRPRTAVVLATGLGLAVLLIPLEHFLRIRNGFAGSDRSAALRVNELNEAMRVIQRFPLLGIGYGEAPHADIFAGVSNAWLWLMERAGILAGLVHLGLIAGVARRANSHLRFDKDIGPFYAALVSFTVAGVFDHHIVSFPHLVYLFGSVVGVIVARRAGNS